MKYRVEFHSPLHRTIEIEADGFVVGNAGELELYFQDKPWGISPRTKTIQVYAPGLWSTLTPVPTDLEVKTPHLGDHGQPQSES